MNIWKECISSGSKVSSKRVVTLVAFLLMALGYLMNLFFDFKIDRMIYESMEMIVITGLGFVTSEHLLKKRNGESEKVESKQQLNG